MQDEYRALIKLRHRGADGRYRNIEPGETFSDISEEQARALIESHAVCRADEPDAHCPAEDAPQMPDADEPDGADIPGADEQDEAHVDAQDAQSVEELLGVKPVVGMTDDGDAAPGRGARKAQGGQMSLRDNIQRDITGVFMNLDEFAGEHTWNGRAIRCVIDNDGLSRKGVRSTDWDNNTGEMHMYIPMTELTERPYVNAEVLLDGASWRISECLEEMGIYVLTLIGQAARMF